jgi:hypothetical protein
MSRQAAQRDEMQRAIYWDAIYSHIPHPSCLVFGDETALDGRTARRKRGWGGLGSRVSVAEIWHRGRMVSVLALYTRDAGFVAWAWVEGGYNMERFMEHIEQLIDLVLQPFPGPSSVLVLDNCRIHHAQEDHLRAACRRRGGQLLFLAPYCPIDNPVESGFSVFKACWRRNASILNAMSVHEAVGWGIANCYIDPAEVGKSFDKCGYSVPSREHSESIRAEHAADTLWL